MRFIIMADVIKSRETDLASTAQMLKLLCVHINNKYKKSILSPLTITLGDEFQGIADSAKTGLLIIIEMEEMILKNEIDFKLRYILLYGPVETMINNKTAYEMLGEGLTEASHILTAAKKEKYRFYVCGTPNADLSDNLFRIYQSIIDDWKVKDYVLITNMINDNNNKYTAAKAGKNPSQIWKRKKTLKIEEYQILKKIILTYV
jgi:SatD family (SatD)